MSVAVSSFLGLVFVLCSATVTSSGEEHVLNLDEFLEQKVQKFKVDFHRTLEADRVRHKRDTGELVRLTRDDNILPVRLPVSPLTSDVTDLSEFRVTCWAWTLVDPVLFPASHLLLVVTQDGRFVLMDFDGNQFKVLLELAVQDKAYKAQVFSVGNYVWLMVAYESASNHWIQMYRYDGKEVIMKQTIPLTGAVDMAVVYNRGDWYMAVATLDQLVLYEWRQTQFDGVAFASVTGVRSLAIWSSAGAIYVATAVHAGGERAAESLLFVYAKRTGKLTRIQVLLKSSATKVVHFVVEGNDYLLFLGHDAAIIYWWAGDQFLEFQSLKGTAGALDAATLLLPNGEVAIVLAFQYEILFYLEGFSSEYYMVYSRSQDLALSSGLLFFFRHNSYYFLFFTFDLASFDSASSFNPDLVLPNNVWRLNLTPFQDRKREEDPLLTCIQSLKKRLNFNLASLEHVESNIVRVWVDNKEQVIQAPVVIKGFVEVKGGLGVEEVVLQVSQKMAVPQVTSSDLREDLLYNQDILASLEQEMGGLLFKSVDQVITGDLLFLNTLKVQNAQFKFLENDVFLNGVPISKLAENTLRVHGDQVLWHSLEASQLDARNVFLEGSFNGMQPLDMILLAGNEIVEREIHFTNVVVQDVVLASEGTINGLPEQIFVKASQPQIIHGVKTFQNLVVKGQVVVKGKSGQRDLSEFVQNILLLDNLNQEDFSQVQFSSPIIVEGDVYINGLINGMVDLHALATKTLDLHSDQLVTGRKTFSFPVFVNGDVNVDGLTNGVDVSEQLLTLSTDQHIPGVVVFDTIEIMGNLTTGTINGYDLKTDAVTKQGPPQFITGRKEFTQSVQVLLDVEMSEGSTVNGLDLSMLVEAANRAEGVVLFGTTSFHSLVIQELLTSDAINGVSLDNLYHNLWRKSTDQIVQHSVQLSKPIIVESDLKVTSGINGYDLSDDFVHIAGDEEISGYINFVNSVYIHGELRMAPGKTINNFDISEYNRSVVPSQRDSVISGHVIIPSLEVNGNLIINGGLRGMRMDNFLQIDKEQVVTGHVTLLSNTTEVLGDLFVDILNLEQDINGVDFSEFDKHVIYDFESSLIGMAVLENKEFIGDLIVGGITAQGRVDGVDIEELRRSAVLLSSDEEISVPKNLTKAEFLADLSVDYLNAVPLSKYLGSVVLNTDEIISGPKTISGSVIVNGDLNIQGQLNGVDIPEIAANAAFRDTDIAFKGLGVIIGNLIVGELILAKESHLDGLPLSQLTFLNENQALAGRNTFLDEVTAGEIRVMGLINGCQINELLEEAVYLSRPLESFSGSLTIGSLIVHGDMEVSGRLGDVSLHDLAQVMLSKTADQTLTSSVRFNHLAAGNIQVESVNQVHLAEIMQDAVLKSKPQTISGAKAFVHPSGLSVKNEVLILGDLLVDGRVNGVELNELMHVVVLKNDEREIHGIKSFLEVEVQGDIFIQGTLNGVSVPKDVILLFPEEHVEASLLLVESSVVEGQLWAGGLVDGVLLHQFILDRVTLFHHQDIQATIRFEDVLTTEYLQVLGRVNNIPIEDIVMRRDKVVISGQKTFAGAVTITGDLAVEQLNGVVLADFERDLVRIDQPEVITHSIEFITEVDVQNDLVILESINDVQLGHLVEEFSAYRSGLSQHLEVLQGHINSLQQNLKLSQPQILKHQFLELLYFEAFQYLDAIITKTFSIPKPSHSDAQIGWSVPEKIIGWTPSTCGHSTVTFEVGKDGHLDHSLPLHQPGRMIPLIDSHSPGDGAQFLLWTNSTSSAHRCSLGLREESMISVHEQNEGILQAFPFFSSLNGAVYVEDAKLFVDHDHTYLLAVYSLSNLNVTVSHGVVLRYNVPTSAWTLHQRLYVGEIASVDLAQVNPQGGEHHLLVAMTDGWLVRFYKWTDQAKFDLMMEVSSPGAEIVLWFIASDGLHLLVANTVTVQPWGASDRGPPLSVYSYLLTGHLQWTHNLQLPELSHLHSFSFIGEAYVVASSRLHQVSYVLQWRGHMQGLVTVQKIVTPEVTDVTSYWSVSGDFFLLITSTCQTSVFKAVTLGFGYR